VSRGPPPAAPWVHAPGSTGRPCGLWWGAAARPHALAAPGRPAPGHPGPGPGRTLPAAPGGRLVQP